MKLLSRVRPLAAPWTAAYQAPLSMGFSRQEYWSGVPLPSLLYGAIHVLILVIACVEFPFFKGWIIFHYICLPYFVFPFIHLWTLELLLPFGTCEPKLNLGVQISVWAPAIHSLKKIHLKHTTILAKNFFKGEGSTVIWKPNLMLLFGGMLLYLNFAHPFRPAQVL